MPKRIFHVDDDGDIRAAVQKVLAEEKFEIVSFDSVQNFFGFFDAVKPDLVILDVMVEREDSGLVAYDELCKTAPDIPVIILTTLGELILPYFENRKDMVTILEKPIMPENLIAAVWSRLR